MWLFALIGAIWDEKPWTFSRNEEGFMDEFIVREREFQQSNRELFRAKVCKNHGY